MPIWVRYMIAGVCIETFGLIALATGFEGTGRILAVHPNSLLFYAAPAALIDHLPQSLDFVIGFIVGSVFWAAVVAIAVLFWKRAHRRRQEVGRA